MTPREQIETLGRARVLVVLRSPAPGRTGAALADAQRLDQQAEAATKLKPAFFRTDLRNTRLRRDLADQHDGVLQADVVVDRRVRRAVGASLSGPRYYPHLGVMLGDVDAAGLAQLNDDAAVDAVISTPEFSLIRPEMSAALADPPPGVSWALQRMRFPELWDRGLTGAGVLVGHLDTGVDARHPALDGAIDVFARFDVLGRQVADAQPADTGFHGTHTAGLLVGRAHGGRQYGGAPGATLASAEVIEGGDIPARVVAGLDWCVGQGVRIVNLSLGVPQFEPMFASMLQLLRARGVLPVVAIGNSGPQTSRTPGNLPEALSVGAIDAQENIWLRSSSQQFANPARIVPSLVAPGVEIYSCAPGGDLNTLSGTSMAAPHVSALAALLLERRPDLTVSQLENAIYGSCSRPTSVSTQRGNRGVPDAVEALSRI